MNTKARKLEKRTTKKKKGFSKIKEKKSIKILMKYLSKSWAVVGSVVCFFSANGANRAL